MDKNTITFVCEHGAAKSIVASAYFNKLAAEDGLRIRSIARGTHPDAEISQNAIIGLRADGLFPGESIPQKLTHSDVESAHYIVTFCELPEDYQQKAPTESWDDVPAVSDGYEAARDAIVRHIEKLIEQLDHEER